MMTVQNYPEGWKTKRLKFAATYNDEVLSENTDDLHEIKYVEISGVSLAKGIETINPMTFFEAPSRARRKVKSGDVLVSTVRTYLKAIAKVDKAPDDLIASTGFCVVRPHVKHDSGFIGWVAKSEPFVSEVVARSVGVSYPAINASELVNIEIPLPPLETQQRIARFLDEKTERIDALIEKKRELLDRLAEKRQALITRAVTKGLNPDAPMKPSGIDWLEDIPAHWEVKRLRFLIENGTLNGLYKPKDQFSPEGVPFVQMGEAFRGVVFTGGTADRVLTSKSELEKWGLRKGDFLIARRSLVFEGSGKSVLVLSLDEEHLFESSMIRIRPCSSNIISPFLSLYFQSVVGRALILSITKQVTISGIDSQQLKNLPIPIPPKNDLEKIVEHCDHYDSWHMKTDSYISKSIDTLIDCRNSIITSAVTGQIHELV